MVRAVDTLKQAVLKREILQPRKKHRCPFNLLPPPPPSRPPPPPPPPPPLSIAATSLNRPCSSVPKMTVVERLDCNLNNNLSPLQVDAVYRKSELASIYQGCEVQGFRYRRIRNGCFYLPRYLSFICHMFFFVLECFDLQNCAVIRVYFQWHLVIYCKSSIFVYKNY